MAKPKCILLVDDDQVSNFLHMRLLKRLKICDTIHTFVTGTSALKHLQNEKKLGHNAPEYIFFDLKMPIMNGFEFLEEFHRLELLNRKKIKVIALTNSTDYRDIERLKFMNCHEIIHKPLSEIHLYSLFPDAGESQQRHA